jgi:cytochrome c-type biogenesis protein
VRIETVTFGAYLLAFGGGIISFLSPCVLPIVPGYLSVVTGLDVTDTEGNDRQKLWGIARDSGIFVAGFTIVFVMLGLISTGIGKFFLRNQVTLTRISGLVILLLALFMLGSLVLKAPWLYQEKRFHPQLGRFGRFAPLVAGLAFGFGWSPCIGPILGSILTIAAQQERIWAGGTLLLAYSSGLGLSFLVTGLAFGKVAGLFGFIKRHFTGIVAGSAIVLGVFGVVLLMNRLSWLTSELTDFLRSIGLDFIADLAEV